MTEKTYKRINSASEAKNRLKWLLIGQVIFWILWGIMVLIFGDGTLAQAANPGFEITEAHWIYKVVKLYSDTFYVLELGTLVVTILVLAIPKAKPYRRTMLEALFSLAFAAFQVESLKRIVGRPRPFQDNPAAYNIFGETTDSGSMPSGHVAYTGAAAWPHAIWAKKLIVSILIAAFSAGMMYIRMFLGVHYATDVLVGNIISVVSAALSFLLFQKIYKKGEISRKKEWLLFACGFLLFAVILVVVNVVF